MIKLITIAKNTLIETLRQPIYAIIVGCAVLLFILSPSITMYTMDDDNKLLREIGLSTLFITSLFIAIFSASGAVAEEMDNKTISTVLSKPVSRPTFILAKFLGICGAVALAHYTCSIALMMAIRHGVLETAADTHDWTVITAGAVAVFGSLALATFFSYVFGWKFSATCMVLLAILATGALLFLLMVDRQWTVNPAENGFNRLDAFGALLLFLAAVVISALALAFSCRFNIVVTLSACVGVFLLGLISDYVFTRFADTHLWAQIGRYLIPNLQVFWIADAIYEEGNMTLGYIGRAAAYALCYAGGILALAVALFQRRQVG